MLTFPALDLTTQVETVTTATITPTPVDTLAHDDDHGTARCPICGLISYQHRQPELPPRHCPRCLTGHLQPVQNQFIQISAPQPAHSTS